MYSYIGTQWFFTQSPYEALYICTEAMPCYKFIDTLSPFTLSSVTDYKLIISISYTREE